MAAVEYGTVAIVPKGDFINATQYDVGNLVTWDGSSYVAFKRPPIATLPSNNNYWQISAQGGGRATVNKLGSVKPDGTTIKIKSDGTIFGDQIIIGDDIIE